MCNVHPLFHYLFTSHHSDQYCHTTLHKIYLRIYLRNMVDILIRCTGTFSGKSSVDIFLYFFILHVKYSTAFGLCVQICTIANCAKCPCGETGGQWPTNEGCGGIWPVVTSARPGHWPMCSTDQQRGKCPALTNHGTRRQDTRHWTLGECGHSSRLCLVESSRRFHNYVEPFHI